MSLQNPLPQAAPVRDGWPATRHGRWRLNLALQGGGAHGAFTWGVLDRLAGVDGLEVSAISGSSAGAVNAVVFASGWIAGGPDGARAALAELWGTIGREALRLQTTGLSHAVIDTATSLLSPYQLNPFNLNPLRDLLERLVDFDALRRARRPALLIAATNLRTGGLRLFDNAGLSLEAVLASACLPAFHHAVEIDGEAYWDGAYVSNPPVLALVERSKAPDTLLVRINVGTRDDRPRSAAGIRSRVGEIVFDQPLTRELELLEAQRGQGGRLGAWLSVRGRRLARHRLHVIDGAAATAALAPATRLLPDTAVLEGLRELGRNAAADWLAGAQGA
ncbi:MAG: patatin-like phospholipase family protein [Geminicoccaceae bacterium]